MQTCNGKDAGVNEKLTFCTVTSNVYWQYCDKSDTVKVI